METSIGEFKEAFKEALPGTCSFVRDHGAAYKALAQGQIQMTVVPLALSSKTTVGSPAAAGAAGLPLPASSDVDDEAFEEALVRLERVSQRLVVEQQYGQRLEALTSSLVSKTQSWVVRLRKEEATRNRLKETLDILRWRKQQQQQAQGRPSPAPGAPVEAAGAQAAARGDAVVGEEGEAHPAASRGQRCPPRLLAPSRRA